MSGAAIDAESGLVFVGSHDNHMYAFNTSYYIPGIHPLYTFITICTPMYTRNTCIYTIYYTPNTPLNTLHTPYIRLHKLMLNNNRLNASLPAGWRSMT